MRSPPCARGKAGVGSQARIEGFGSASEVLLPGPGILNCGENCRAEDHRYERQTDHKNEHEARSFNALGRGVPGFGDHSALMERQKSTFLRIFLSGANRRGELSSSERLSVPFRDEWIRSESGPGQGAESRV